MKRLLSIAAVIALFTVHCSLITSPAFATACSANRNTPQLKGAIQLKFTVKLAEVIYAGAIVSVDSNGEAVEATDSATDQVVGRAAEYVDNTADGKTIKVDVGVFGWAKSGTINDANIGDLVYVVDDQTVAIANPGNACIAGIVVYQDSSYAYVDTSYLPRTAGTFTTLSASGAATLGSTLTMTGVATFTAQPIFNGGIDVNEDIDIDFDATDEEVDITTSSYAAKLFRIYSSSANPSTMAMLELDLLADGDADATFIQCKDNSSGDSKFSVGPDGNTAVAGTLAVTGASTIPITTPVADTSAARVLTSADYGKIIIVSSNAAVAVTLPANGAAAGSWVDIMVGTGGTDSCAPTISAATTDTLIGPNDIDLKSVTWGSGHRIGAYARFISDGSFWHVLNLGGTTMTYTD